MSEQMTLDSLLGIDGEDLEDLSRQVIRLSEYAKTKRNWENAFQKWSDEHGRDGSDSTGCCGFGYMCDYCEDNAKGRPCVRALNKMCRSKGICINYQNRNFSDVWYGNM